MRPVCVFLSSNCGLRVPRLDSSYQSRVHRTMFRNVVCLGWRVFLCSACILLCCVQSLRRDETSNVSQAHSNTQNRLLFFLIARSLIPPTHSTHPQTIDTQSCTREISKRCAFVLCVAGSDVRFAWSRQPLSGNICPDFIEQRKPTDEVGGHGHVPFAVCEN